jgi:hypothetical protein
MPVVSLTAIQLKPGVSWEEAQKSLKKGNDLVRKHGGENVTAMVGMAAGTATGTVSLVYTAEDWTKYGQLQDSLFADPEMQALMADPNSPAAGWDTYVMQTIPDL